MTKIVFVAGEDWQGVYVNGELATENHSVMRYYEMEPVFRLIAGVELSRIPQTSALDEYLYENGSLPDTLDELHKGLKAYE